MKIELETAETISLTETTNKIMDLAIALLRPRTLAPMKVVKPEDKGPSFLDIIESVKPLLAEIIDRVLPDKGRDFLVKKISFSELPQEVKDALIEEIKESEETTEDTKPTDKKDDEPENLED